MFEVYWTGLQVSFSSADGTGATNYGIGLLMMGLVPQLKDTTTRECRHGGYDQTCKLGKQVNWGATLTKHSLQCLAFRPLFSSK